MAPKQNWDKSSASRHNQVARARAAIARIRLRRAMQRSQTIGNVVDTIGVFLVACVLVIGLVVAWLWLVDRTSQEVGELLKNYPALFGLSLDRRAKRMTEDGEF
ncbi:MAG: hypothetical protein GY811_23815 [Myxococcales bacterium]|nr:hypothetical protein [Myxococcales bacterium]